MSGWWRAVGQWLSRRTLVTLLAVAAVTAPFAAGLGRLDFATGQDSYIDPGSQVAADNKAYQDLFAVPGGPVLARTAFGGARACQELDRRSR